MKKYFAKHIPIEGEIKEGDKVYYKDKDKIDSDWSGIYTVEQIYSLKGVEDKIVNIQGDCFNTGSFLSNLTKVKLFLCSRDIQVGDTVHYDGDHNIKWKVDKLHSMSFTSGSSNIDSRYVYKIIGEISPDATWVKERDEFDESEFKKGKRIVEDTTPFVGWETRTYWGDRVKILKLGDNFRGHLCEYLDEAELNHHITCRKGETYEYFEGNLGFTDKNYYLIKGPCRHFH